MLSGKFKAEHVEKDVKCIVPLNLFPRQQVQVRDEYSQEVKHLVTRVGLLDGEIGIVSNLKQDELVVYKGVDVVA